MTISPELCRLIAKPFDDPGWKWERKWDGVRMLAFVDEWGRYRLQARSGADKTAQFPELRFNCNTDVILDGEMVAADDKLSFQDFAQRRINRTAGIERAVLDLPAKYMGFDILNLGGRSVEESSLFTRQCLLDTNLRESRNVRITARFGSGIELFEGAKAEGWEGVVGKNLDEPYLRGKRNWVKVKVWHEGVFSVVGFTLGTGKRKNLFGALLLEDAVGHSVGRVGTGFTDEELYDINTLLHGYQAVYDKDGNTRLYNPLQAKIKYVETTNDGKLRFPVWEGLA